MKYKKYLKIFLIIIAITLLTTLLIDIIINKRPSRQESVIKNKQLFKVPYKSIKEKGRADKQSQQNKND